jgi:eukaryotic-like serine/threonine-protein kinase
MNSRSNRQIEKAIFDVSTGIDDSRARQEFLTMACAGDEARFSRIAGWLGMRDAAEDYFRTATIVRAEVGGDVLGSLDEGLVSAERSDAPDPYGPGAQIGRYVLLERIGEGGCGVVYLAEQSEPVRRKVALKVIRRGLDTESVIARFEIERQSLALMDHPNIARVLDAATTESGQPFFVMELVYGAKITDHCDNCRLGLRPRLELFIQVCNAIQHAHQKGIIHRDIKPSNILVTPLDGQAAPKVIDFGIARAVESGFSGDTRITAGAQLVGTPAYMSPEQAEGSLDLDTRGDIYSLGVLLHELLTGRPPFDGKRLAQAGMLEMLRILREEEPVAPSALLGRLASVDQSEVATSRDTTSKSLVSALRGDLDGIILKALAKDRQSRYATVAGLAADVQRHLNDEPVCARSPGRFYLFKKLVRRNKLQCGAALAIALSLLAGGAFSSWFYFRERSARQAAEAARANEARLLQQSKAREAVSMAATLLAEGKITEADALLVKTPLASIEPTLDALMVFRAYGDWNVIRRRWNHAAECYDFFIKADGFNRVSPSEVSWILMAIGVAQVEAGTLQAYEELRDMAVARYDNSDDFIFGAIVIKSCLLAPAGSHVLEGLQPLADLVERKLTSPSAVGIEAFQSAFAAMSMGLMEYRKGNFSVAQKWCRMCLDFPDANDARSATAHAIGAMAARKLGQLELARSELARAQEFLARTVESSHMTSQWPGRGYWHDCGIARLLVREAETLAQ